MSDSDSSDTPNEPLLTLYDPMLPIISIRDLGKKYRIRHQSDTPYRTLKEDLAQLPRRIFRGKTDEIVEEYWALKEVSLEIEQGDRVGIIGRNGAGKSTLLKLLSQITEPSKGSIILRGRVASLLEVGTGFHPELTGRENVFLNGAILGMSRGEVKRKFDEIVAFAAIERFLDTPVKRYSSGMYVRLAFAVAAHLESEVLVIDEVLSVGDAEFQKKCLGKVEGVSRQEGRTILFVSHNMNAIQTLCNRAVRLEGGSVARDTTDIRLATHDYLGFGAARFATWRNPAPSSSKLPVVPLGLHLHTNDDQVAPAIVTNDEPLWVVVDIELKALDPALTFGYALHTEDGQLLYCSYQTDCREVDWPRLSKGTLRLKTPLPRRLLNEGNYRLEFMSRFHGRQWLTPPGSGPTMCFSVQGGLCDSPLWQERRPGILAPVLPWYLATVESP